MASHSSILAWKIPQTEEPGIVHGGKESDMRVHTHTHAPESRVLSHRIILLMPFCPCDRLASEV